MTEQLAEYQDFHALDEFAAAADSRWTPAARDFIGLGAGRGLGILANESALQSWALRTRVLRDVSSIDTSTHVLGAQLAMPVLLGPSALHVLSTAEGEAATARAAARTGTVLVLSASTSRSIEDVAAAGARMWFQLYWGRDRERVTQLIRMAEEHGCTALCVTVDMSVPGVLGSRMAVALRGLGDARPLYVLPRDTQLDSGEWDHDSRLTWRDLEWMRATTTLPIVLKGIMTAEDARLAAEHGVDALVVSNHGGRALDTPRATIDALPEVVDAVAGTSTEVYVDGGFRTGTDIAVALALGARAVLIGRPVLWGLATGGEGGLVALLSLLRGQLTSVMGMVGAASVAEIDRARVCRTGAGDGSRHDSAGM
ncbi:alpha-hydroxy-acid oxidizing protein [Lysinimonas soli]|uniref:Alpha-hydroxy-acid oxidizing protein n=1 Tax=Lysinimonas soli TaxID=1074233 RepID=A0ABW0NLI3_9MICO